MNLLNKTMPWIAGSLLAATSIFGDDRPVRKTRSFEHGQAAAKTQMASGYNAPARIDVRGSWDVFASGSFIYWQLSQDNMELAFANTTPNASYDTTAAVNQLQGNLVQMDFNYKLGVKVGLGSNLGHDDWDSYAEYIRIYTSNTMSTNGSNVSGTTTPSPILPTWGNPFIQPLNAYNSASEGWECNLNIVNWDLARSYYVGQQLTFRPFFGARAAWITQNVHVRYINTGWPNASVAHETLGTLDVYQRNRSWALGPRIGLETKWVLGQGIRFFGNANGDILYTKYKIQNKTNFLFAETASAGLNEFVITRETPGTVRTHAELEAGLGWGSYFDNNNWHIDLSAAYSFQAFFDQNMLSMFPDSSMPARTIQPAGNLYAQGLTAAARLDF